MGLVADAQVGGRDGNAALVEFVDFGEELFRVEDHAVSDDVHDAFAEDTDGEEVGGVFLVTDADGVTGVGSAAVAGDKVDVVGEEVDDFAFAFVAPLKTDDTRITGRKQVHSTSLSKAVQPGVLNGRGTIMPRRAKVERVPQVVMAQVHGAWKKFSGVKSWQMEAVSNDR